MAVASTRIIIPLLHITAPVVVTPVVRNIHIV